ncbi:MAG: TRAP transporter substrate-binding protein [Pseudomonadota bacterium]|nr:hypothetical protein [Gammaproteobacteria bacterium]MEE2684283.1 TRAP transporter substrate-binding protein [Pseudomonadota bacterium]|tara:strand:- start:3573 stop:4571 length:999 start_codon:yes stop_codon:yes gene_type:complete
MNRRIFLSKSAIATLSFLTISPRSDSSSLKPIRIIMGGYSPSSTSFSLSLKLIGDRLNKKMPNKLNIKYAFNVLNLGYSGGYTKQLVEDGALDISYSSVTVGGGPELELSSLPFLFPSNEAARESMDGPLGISITKQLEKNPNLKVLGFFENGFRHISNSIKPIRAPEDMKNLKIRILAGKFPNMIFTLLGAKPIVLTLTDSLSGIKAGTVEAQENPFSNTVTYDIHKYHRYHTNTGHLYFSRAIFAHKPSFDLWPEEIQQEIILAVKDAVTYQRKLRDQEEIDAQNIITKLGGEITYLSKNEKKAFIDVSKEIYNNLKNEYSAELLKLVNL